ncbi:scavenger receptor cysteine-rich domain-containing protein DMBT1-like [Babylonia areolata]|uniref:scavenger receptor cysteine-rich domain-containing protein DMBT1-like n=1 Tax=Babylonia areolata TaxID=304850 RepID=UPI003FD52022
MVACRSLGFWSGVNVTSSTYHGATAAPALIVDPRCEGGESSIASCPMVIYNNTAAARHYGCTSRPAAVRCAGDVILTPNKTFGALQMMVNNATGSFGLVCADGFGPAEATVACRDLGFPYGLQMSGSAFGYIYSPRIQITNLQCSGNEAALRDCSYSDSLTYCPSRKYASVVCSRSSPRSGYSVALETSQGHAYGRVKVWHMGHWGYVCPDSFRDSEANVLCREAGYAGGVAYQHDTSSASREIHWLKDIGCTGEESFLAHCQNVAWGNVTGCSRYTDAAVFCYQRAGPEFRLVNGTASMGRLELVSENTVGSVCGEEWSNWAAVPACRGMGFKGGRYLGDGLFGQGSGNNLLVSEVYCHGKESSLFGCPLRLSEGTSRCNSNRLGVAVQCFNTTRLSGSRLATYGRVEVLTNQTWVAVCDQGFDTNAAQVVCRTLGYSAALPQCCSALGPLHPYYRQLLAARKIGVKVNSCNGSEASLLDCDVTVTGTCSSEKYASVLCSNDSLAERPLQVRLQQESTTHSKPVLVNRYGFWGPVCSTGWDDRDANATCHGLGYTYGISLYGRNTTDSPRVVGNVQCSGQEASLADCPFGDMDDPLNCTGERRDAGVLCSNSSGDGSLRLVGGGRNWGQVEMLIGSHWGRVVDYMWGRWTDTDATVACRQLGFKTGYADRKNRPRVSGRVAMSLVQCSGKESRLLECLSDWDQSIELWSAQIATVICNDDVRLVDRHGNAAVSRGLVEVNINKRWGQVCDNHWTDLNTHLTCQNLGYDHGIQICCGGFSWRAIMDNVACNASDTNLSTCSHDVPGVSGCTSHNVAVTCYNGNRSTDYSYGLGRSRASSGEVEITYLNITGHICSDGWDDTDARVFCSELGYPHGQAFSHPMTPYSSTFDPIWATRVNCNGTESRLRDCRLELGNVSYCQSVAGVTCTNNQGIFYRLQPINGNSSSWNVNRGRVEVSVDGVWGQVCRWDIGYNEAQVFCRSQGFKDGRMYSPRGVFATAAAAQNASSAWFTSRLRCTGQEGSLNECAHTGWVRTSDRYCLERPPAYVLCSNGVRIGYFHNPDTDQGSVQFHADNTWYNLCDTGFDDVTASRVCQDLEFVDGRAVLGSAYGSSDWMVQGFNTHLNHTMHCEGQERSSTECIHANSSCASGNYASVVCFRSTDRVNETYSFDFVDSTRTSGVVAVTHMNVTGRVCNNGWDDSDAKVLCRSKGHPDGIAFHFSQDDAEYFRYRGPFWVSGVNCTGNETSLEDCPFNDRLHLGNCSKADLAGAVCFNDSGIQYRLSSDVPKANEGRVEISVGGVWGTVCKYFWDDREARVFCRNQGYSDGYSIRNTFGTRGSGPMWLSYLRCQGTESSLHQCSHDGFSDAPVDDGYYSYGCSSHNNDAYVSCVDKLKLNLGYEAHMGAVMVHRRNQWNLICDSGLDHTAAQVVCRELGFHFGTFIKGSKFGKVDANITISKVQCRGTETDFSTCTFETSVCKSQKYASVFCRNDAIIEETPNVRIVRDKPSDSSHGYLEYQVDGVWGAVCARTMDTSTVSVACRQLGFTGGVKYTPHNNSYQQPILTSDLKCRGTENSLDQCPRVPVTSAWCDFYAPRAGLLCYNDTDGISYRLTGDSSDPSRGRVEMKYMGQYGYFCSFSGNNKAARVACKSLGFGGGLAVTGIRYLPSFSQPTWLSAVACLGNESGIPECSSQGFNMPPGFYTGWRCRTRDGPFSVQCFQEELAITEVRLVEGDSDSSGRVEVFLKGPNQWGTVCDDGWNDVDATVVCNQLGFATGRAVKRAGFGRGRGHVWLSQVGCNGTETRLQDCGFDGFQVSYCGHSRDAGAVCSGVYVPPTVKPETEKHAGDEDHTAAIVTPLVLLLLLGIAAGVGFFLYRRRRSTLNVQKLVDSRTAPPSSSSSSLSFGQGGVVRFFSKTRGPGQGESGADGSGTGVSNPCYDNLTHHPVQASAAAVFAVDHADFGNSDI